MGTVTVFAGPQRWDSLPRCARPASVVRGSGVLSARIQPTRSCSEAVAVRVLDGDLGLPRAAEPWQRGYLALAAPSASGIDAATRNVLGALECGEPYNRWLLIFDNADQPEEPSPFVPGGPGDALITSHDHRWISIIDTVALDVFTQAESAKFLPKRIIKRPAIARLRQQSRAGSITRRGVTIRGRSPVCSKGRTRSSARPSSEDAGFAWPPAPDDLGPHGFADLPDAVDEIVAVNRGVTEPGARPVPVRVAAASADPADAAARCLAPVIEDRGEPVSVRKIGGASPTPRQADVHVPCGSRKSVPGGSPGHPGHGYRGAVTESEPASSSRS